MRFSNEQIMHEYVYQKQASGSTNTNNCHYKGTTLYSYTTPIAKLYRNNNCIIITNKYYSNTTSKHISYLKSAIPCDMVVIKSDCLELDKLQEYTTNELVKFINNCKILIDFDVPKMKNDRQELHRICTNIKVLFEQVVASPIKINSETSEIYHKCLYYLSKLNKYNNYKRKLREQQRAKYKQILMARHKDIIDKFEVKLNGFKQSLGDNIDVQYIVSNYPNFIHDFINSLPNKIQDRVYYKIHTWLQSIYYKTLLNYNHTSHIMYVINDKDCTGEWYIKTDRGISIKLTKQLIKTFKSLVKLYLNNKYNQILYKHFDCYKILKANDKTITIGCHTFDRQNIINTLNVINKI